MAREQISAQKPLIQVGDMIRVNRFGYQHVGIYIGDRGVLHNCKGVGVMVSSLEQFSGGTEIFMHLQATVPHHERWIIVQRAFSLLGSQYDLLNFNCEHAAYYAQSGKAVSPQANNFAVAGMLFAGLALISLLSSKKA